MPEQRTPMPDTTATDTPIRFPDRLRLRVPRGLSAAVELAAGRHHTSPSEWARQALLRGLEDEGLRLINGRVETVQNDEFFASETELRR